MRCRPPASEAGDQLLARIGGDEFALLGLGCDRDASVLVAQRLASALRPPFELGEIVIDIDASAGISLCPEHGTDGQTLLRRAEVAMYRSKETHAGHVLYDERFDDHRAEKLALTAELAAAIEDGQITVFYQPEMDAQTEAVNAVEALVRWQHPRRGLLAPGAFLDIAEHTNLIKPLTQKVLAIALGQVAQWRGAGIDVTVAVTSRLACSSMAISPTRSWAR